MKTIDSEDTPREDGSEVGVNSSKLEYLDISYAKLVTDEGLAHFEGKKFPIQKLFI